MVSTSDPTSGNEDKLANVAEVKNTTPTDSGGKNTPRNKSPKAKSPRSPKSKSPTSGGGKKQTAQAATTVTTAVKKGKSDQDDGNKRMFDSFFRLT